jgi:hypothetical protein
LAMRRVEMVMLDDCPFRAPELPKSRGTRESS